MAEDEEDERTELPTGKRLGEARERGQLPISREVTAWGSFLAIFLIIITWLARMAHEMPPGALGFSRITTHLVARRPKSSDHHFRQYRPCRDGIRIDFYIDGGGGDPRHHVANRAFRFAGISSSPDFSRISITAGMKKLFSMNNLVEFGKALGKLLMLGTAAVIVLKPLLQDLPSLTGLPF